MFGSSLGLMSWSQSSGVGVSADCLTQYQELKLKKKLKFIIFKLNDTNTEIIVDKTSTESDYEQFLENLPEDQPRWAVYDFEYTKGEGKRNKLTFYSWYTSLSSKPPILE